MMHILEMELKNFFEDNEPFYHNEIEFMYDDSGFNHLACCVPGYEEHGKYPSLELAMEFDSLCDFIREFLIIELDDIKKITRDDIYRRFLVGRSELYCSLDDNMNFFLLFKRNGLNLYASTKDGQTHEVPHYIQTPKDVIIYTAHYFEKLLTI